MFDPSSEVLNKPPCGTYEPDDKTIKPQRFSKVTFGFGKKYLGQYTPYNPKPTPGPGTYKGDLIWGKSSRHKSRRSGIHLFL